MIKKKQRKVNGLVKKAAMKNSKKAWVEEACGQPRGIPVDGGREKFGSNAQGHDVVVVWLIKAVRRPGLHEAANAKMICESALQCYRRLHHTTAVCLSEPVLHTDFHTSACPNLHGTPFSLTLSLNPSALRHPTSPEPPYPQPNANPVLCTSGKVAMNWSACASSLSAP